MTNKELLKVAKEAIEVEPKKKEASGDFNILVHHYIFFLIHWEKSPN